MEPNAKWINDWRVGVDSSREVAVAKQLLELFSQFWNAQNLSSKSKSTRSRYRGSLHALGGYLVEQAISDADRNKTTDELLDQYLYPDEDPLIFLDNEVWQDELDQVCRKLYRYMKSKNRSNL